MKLVFLVALVAACSSSPKSQAVPADEAQKLLIDRNWLDKMPETERDRIHVYRFVPKMGGGVYQDRTIYKGTFELFKFKATGDEIKFNLPETKTKVSSAYTIEKVNGPDKFDLRLTIFDSPRGPKVYYGWRDEMAGELLEQRFAATNDED